jgi:hypothetical protein
VRNRQHHRPGRLRLRNQQSGAHDPPTWNTYLAWLDDFASGVSGTVTAIKCGGGGSVACLSMLAEKFPPIGVAISGLGCAAAFQGPSAIKGCLGVGAWGLKAVVAAIRGVAAVNPEVRSFLDTPMPI